MAVADLPSHVRVGQRQRLVVPQQQLLVFLQRYLGDLAGDLDDGLEVLLRPSRLEAGA